MQEFFGLKVTEQLDASTLEVMRRPRCGFTDVSNYGHFEGRPKWAKTLVTYRSEPALTSYYMQFIQTQSTNNLLSHSARHRITDYTPDLSQSHVDATIAKALKVYSDVIPLDFKQITSGTADIMITFKRQGDSVLSVP